MSIRVHPWLKIIWFLVVLSMANPVVLIVGRLSGPKNEVLLTLLRTAVPVVASKIPGVRFQVVGGPVDEEHRQLEKRFPNVRFEGYQKDLKPFYQRADLVVGAGRVALEAMAMKKPVVAIGERRYIGPLSPEKVEMAKATNFGDCWEKESFDWNQAAQDILQLVKNKKKRDQAAQTGFELVHCEYDMRKIFPQTDAFYRRVLLEKNIAAFHELPVLMYHRVVEQAPDHSKYNIYVTRANLEKQLQFLKVRGFETLTFEDLMTRRVPERPVILTFDDGYEDNYHGLFPLLRKYGMKAVVYLLGNRKHQNNFWDIPQGEPEAPLLKERQILEMAQSGLVEFGAHSMNHARLTDLKPEEARKEVVGAKKSIEGLLQKPVVSFAYPYGIYDEETKKITAEAGYTFGIAVGGRFTRFGDDLMEIRRVHMFPHSSLLDLFKKTTGFYHRYRKLLGR
jgi:peptidoglycan/xylan/chitin deacetylase (PgdA/CDA1 family)